MRIASQVPASLAAKRRLWIAKVKATSQTGPSTAETARWTNSTKYTLVNGSLCLGLSAPVADPNAPPIVQMETCNGSAEQKWNAVPNLLNSTLINTHEN